MNNKEFVNELAKRSNRTVADATKVLDCLKELMKGHLEENDSIAASGFGTFEIKKKMERVSVNPTTGKRYLVPPKLTLSFKQSTLLKEKLNGAAVIAETDDSDSETNNE